MTRLTGNAARRALAAALAAAIVPAALAGCTRRTPSAPARLDAKRVVMIVPHRNFHDDELRDTTAVLEARGARVTVASSSGEPVHGMLGSVVIPDATLDEVSVAAYDAVVFVGGAGAVEYWHDARAHALVQQAVAQEKVLAAICLAPVTLAQSGVLKLKRCTVAFSAAEQLRGRGAAYTGADVQTDGRIVTANGPRASRAFGRAIADVLARPSEG